MMLLAVALAVMSGVVIGLVLAFAARSTFAARDRREERIQRRVDRAIALLGAWSSGDAEQAQPDLQQAALGIARRLEDHARNGTNPLDDVRPYDGSMRAAAEAWGQALTPIQTERAS